MTNSSLRSPTLTRLSSGCRLRFAHQPYDGVRRTLVVEVAYRQRLTGGLRHAALKGIRPDKRPRLIRGFAGARTCPHFPTQTTVGGSVDAEEIVPSACAASN